MFWRASKADSDPPLALEPQSTTTSNPQSRTESGIYTYPDDGQFNPGSNRVSRFTLLDDSIKYKVMLKYIYGRISSNLWFPPPNSGQPHALLLRKSRGNYICEPEDIDQTLLAAVQKMNVEVAFTMATEKTETIFSILQPDQSEIILSNGSQLQVLDSLADIETSGKIKKFQYAALIREEQILLVWHDNLESIMVHAAMLEDKLLCFIWGTEVSPFFSYNSLANSARHSRAPSLRGVPISGSTENTQVVDEIETLEDGLKSTQSTQRESLDRPLVLISSIYAGMAVMLIIVLLMGFGTSNIIFESLTDKSFTRFALFATEPLFMTFSVFFAIVIFTNIFQVFGPIGNLKENSRFYSAVKPNLVQCYSQGFKPSHITIQMPVYKESLKGVIIPTVTSLKASISHYESHGGSASIFINDDGYAFLSETEQEERANFYHDNNIGWVARPKHNENGYFRRGRFKKASNMNFGLNISNRVEKLLRSRVEERLKDEKSDCFDFLEEDAIYKRALAEILAADTRISAGGNIRIGEHILIVDSDTQVPVDCLLYGAAEMFLSQEVAIIQHSTGVMQVSRDYFENGITFFTNLIYSAIGFAVGSGEIAPFVGHNSFLRWEAVQSVGRTNLNLEGEAPDFVAYWSESHVSEDFDMALRLQIAGNIVRLATYHNNEFKEGVSLTIYDELARWEKYAYGCNELIFNPIYTWLWKGPITPLFRLFLTCDLQLSSKITIVGYVSSYYALASGFAFTIMNYFLIGWFNGYLDKFYMESWKVFLSSVTIFSVMGNISLAVLRYRLGDKGLWASLWENFRWVPMFAVFFGGLSFHLSLALLAHMFKIDMQWGATAKEKENSNFFKEIPKIFRNFKWMFLVVFLCFGGMIYLGFYAPSGWQITQITAVVPLVITLICHAILPFVLNPSLMNFNY